MKIIRQNLGVDVDSAELKISLQNLQENLSIKIIDSGTFKNNLKGFEALLKRLSRFLHDDLPLHVTMEVTGVYHEELAYFLHTQENIIVHVELPNTTAAYKKSLNQKSKTDILDARMLGQLGAERQLKEWQPVSNQMRKIKKISRERLRIGKERTLVANQLHAEKASFDSCESCLQRYQQRIDFLNTQEKEIIADLKHCVAQDDDLQQRIDNVCTAKGIGFKTAIGLVAETGGFALFKNRNQLVSYAGYDVEQRSSGTSIKGKTKITKRGNSYIRQIMHMPAMSGVSNDEHHKAYYHRIVSKSGIKMKANVAIQRKMLLLAYSLFTKNEPFDPEYAEKRKAQLQPKKHQMEEQMV